MPRLGGITNGISGGGGRSTSQNFLVNLSSSGAKSEALPLVLSPSRRVRNVSIAGNHDTPQKRKKPLKTTSFDLPHVFRRSRDRTPPLPTRAPEALLHLESPRRRKNRQQQPQVYRASERGKGVLLPTINLSAATGGSNRNLNRPRSISSSNIARFVKQQQQSQQQQQTIRNHSAPTESPRLSTSLRSRRKTIQSDEIYCNGNLLDNNSGHKRNGYYHRSSPHQQPHPHVNQGWVQDESESHHDYEGPITATTALFGSSGGSNSFDYHHQYKSHNGKPAFSSSTSQLSWNDHVAAFAHHPTQHLGKVIMSLKVGHLLQIILVGTILFLVVDSYHQALATTDQLLQFKHDEAMLMLHLKRLEHQSIHLHENLARMADYTATGAAGDNNNFAEQQQQQPPSADGNAAGVDLELILKQTGQLREMEHELQHEVRGLQAKIQKSSRSSIVHAFGEGPVQVVLEVNLANGGGGGQHHHHHRTPEQDDNGAGNNKIAILLWYDTPHAAWTWLEQIQAGQWDDAPFAMEDAGNAITAQPTITAATDGGSSSLTKLDFVESSQKTHEPWTVGLTEFSHADAPGGGIRMFINLQDNTQAHKHDVCVGKVIDGFDVLQKMVEMARRRQQQIIQRRQQMVDEEDEEDEVKYNNSEQQQLQQQLVPQVTIRSATAGHLTRKNSAGIL